MPSDEPHPPSWPSVWPRARAAVRNPVDVLVSAGLAEAAAIVPTEPCGPPRPPPGDWPRHRLKSHGGLDPRALRAGRGRAGH